MKKIVLSLFVIGTFGLYSLYEASQVAKAYSYTANPNAPIELPPTVPQAVPPANTRKYRDGIYNGNSADAYYGFIQVRATITEGELSDIAILKAPNDRPTSVRINAQALPHLKQEAIAAQSGKVNVVSGATDTSYAFQESVGTALAAALVHIEP